MPRRQQIILNDFRGGLNTDAASDHLAPNELASAINVDYSERGSVRKRNGTRKLNQVSYGKPITQIFEWNRANGDVELLAVVGNALCKINANGSKTDIASVSSDRIRYFALQNRLYFVDGTSYRLYDGWQIKDVLINNINVVSVPHERGYEPDTYKFVVTFENTARQESIASEVVEVIITENSTFRVENLPKPLSDTVWRKVYIYLTARDGNKSWWNFFQTADPSVTHAEPPIAGQR